MIFQRSFTKAFLAILRPHIREAFHTGYQHKLLLSTLVRIQSVLVPACTGLEKLTKVGGGYRLIALRSVDYNSIVKVLTHRLKRIA